MQQHGSKYFAPRPNPPPPQLPRDPGVGVNGSKCNFSVHGHFVYQIKGNHDYSNVVENSLPANPYPLPTLGMGSIGQNSTFSEHGHVAYQN